MIVEPVKLEIKSNPPRVLIDGTDITRGIHSVTPELSAHGCFATLVILADIDFEFPTVIREVIQEGTQPTIEGINGALLTSGYDKSPGQKVAEYLRGMGVHVSD